MKLPTGNFNKGINTAGDRLREREMCLHERECGSVCVDDVWFKQPHLARVRLLPLLHWRVQVGAGREGAVLLRSVMCHVSTADSTLMVGGV